jgi:hypothetical protein
MSSFIKNSCNFSEINVLKKSILVPILQEYNECILKLNKVTINESKSFFIPNNNKKFYLLITNKSNKYKTLYFFPDNTINDNLLEINTINDFYMEIDSIKLNDFNQTNYLFEGYIYNNDNYLVTDILSIDSKLIKCDYSLRYSLINNLFINSSNNLQNLNGHLSIGIHPIFEYTDNYKDILNIFQNNFIFKNEINNIEIVKEDDFQKSKSIVYDLNKKGKINKIISKTKFTDVYNVNNIQNNNKEGILYVKTLNDSRLLHKLLDNCETINIECEFNTFFKKWTFTSNF